MIKKLSTLLILLVIGAASAFAINETLAQAQAALKGASTEQQFAHALTLFKSAANDINYNPDTDDRAIADGKAQCNRRLSALRKRLRVDNSAQALSRSFSNQGGTLLSPSPTPPAPSRSPSSPTGLRSTPTTAARSSYPAAPTHPPSSARAS